MVRRVGDPIGGGIPGKQNPVIPQAPEPVQVPTSVFRYTYTISDEKHLMTIPIRGLGWERKVKEEECVVRYYLGSRAILAVEIAHCKFPRSTWKIGIASGPSGVQHPTDPFHKDGRQMDIWYPTYEEKPGVFALDYQSIGVFWTIFPALDLLGRSHKDIMNRVPDLYHWKFNMVEDSTPEYHHNLWCHIEMALGYKGR